MNPEPNAEMMKALEAAAADEGAQEQAHDDAPAKVAQEGSADEAPRDEDYLKFMQLKAKYEQSEDLPYKCVLCDFTSYLISGIILHEQSHGPQGEMCQHCNKYFEDNLHLNLHLVQDHLEQGGDEGNDANLPDAPMEHPPSP